MNQAVCYVDGNGKRRKAKYSRKSPCSEKGLDNNKKQIPQKLGMMKAETSLSATKNDAQTLRRGKFFNSSNGERANKEVTGKEGRKWNTDNGADIFDDKGCRDVRDGISCEKAADKRRRENEYSNDEGSKGARKNKFETSVDDDEKERTLWWRWTRLNGRQQEEG